MFSLVLLGMHSCFRINNYVRCSIINFLIITFENTELVYSESLYTSSVFSNGIIEKLNMDQQIWLLCVNKNCFVFL